MFGHSNKMMSALALSAAMLGAGAMVGDASAAYSGCVSGSNTVDYVYLSSTNNGDRIYYDIDTSGSGSNELDVKIQQQKSGGGWDTRVHFELESGSSRSGSFIVQDFFGSTGELVRVRLGRKILTSSICYTVEHWK